MTPTDRPIPGERVQWTHATVSRRGVVSMSLRQGLLTGIYGAQATVLVGTRTLTIAYSRLRPLDAPTQLGEFVEGMREASRKDDSQ